MCEDPPAPTPPVPTPPVPTCSDSKDCASKYVVPVPNIIFPLSYLTLPPSCSSLGLVCLVSQTDKYCIPSLVGPRSWDCSSANKCPDGSQTLAPCTINGGGSGACVTIQVEFCSSNTRPSSGVCAPSSGGVGSALGASFSAKTHIREVDVIQQPESAKMPESTGHITTRKLVSVVSIATFLLWSIV